MTHHDHESGHAHEPVPAEPSDGGLTGYAAIKYTAIVIIVLAILFFIARFLLPIFD